MKCPRCGIENAADYIFCGGCGASLADAAATVPYQTAGVPAAAVAPVVPAAPAPAFIAPAPAVKPREKRGWIKGVLIAITCLAVIAGLSAAFVFVGLPMIRRSDAAEATEKYRQEQPKPPDQESFAPTEDDPETQPDPGTTPPDTEAPPSDPTITPASALGLLTEGELKVGMETGFQPFEYYTDSGDELMGIDVELANAIGGGLGVNVTFVDAKWDEIFTGLETGLYDAVISAVIITDERKQFMDFSTPYLSNWDNQGEDFAVVVKKGNAALLSEINDVLAEIGSDGTLAAIKDKYSPKPIIVSRISASSTLAPQDLANGETVRYNAENAVDGNINTIWCEGTDGNGIGEYLTVVFSDTVTLTGLYIKNGYWRDNERLVSNSRVGRLEIEFGDGTTETFALSDPTARDYSELVTTDGEHIVFAKSHIGSAVTIIIADVYAGAWEDTCVTEISFE
jgi:ABC-type amino acid transport substrate-binding protein